MFVITSLILISCPDIAIFKNISKYNFIASVTSSVRSQRCSFTCTQYHSRVPIDWNVTDPRIFAISKQVWWLLGNCHNANASLTAWSSALSPVQIYWLFSSCEWTIAGRNSHKLCCKSLVSLDWGRTVRCNGCLLVVSKYDFKGQRVSRGSDKHMQTASWANRAWENPYHRPAGRSKPGRNRERADGDSCSFSWGLKMAVLRQLSEVGVERCRTCDLPSASAGF